LYDQQIREGIYYGLSVPSISRSLTVTDVATACDLLRPVYDRSESQDGYVSLEVSSHLADDPLGTLYQAQELWRAVDRPNLLIKVPGNRVGIDVVEELLYRGINTNISLLFGLEAYRDSLHAYLRAQERRLSRARPREKVPFPGLSLDYRIGEQVATRTAFGEALRQLGNHLPELVVLDGDIRSSTKTERFARAFPERFYEAHIAEQNMAGTALGLGVSGKVPVAATFAAFLTRAYDFIRMTGHSRPPPAKFSIRARRSAARSAVLAGCFAWVSPVSCTPDAPRSCSSAITCPLMT
jgi:hypothetical protein